MVLYKDGKATGQLRLRICFIFPRREKTTMMLDKKMEMDSFLGSSLLCLKPFGHLVFVSLPSGLDFMTKSVQFD